MQEVTVVIKNTSGLPLPSYQTEGAAAVDLLAAIDQDLTLAPGERILVPTGIHIALPKGYELQVRARSGLAAKHGISLVNGIGTIDSDYRGEIQVILLNTSQKPFVIARGDRIAQAVLGRYEKITWEETDELDETSRGQGGFGSTGRNNG